MTHEELKENDEVSCNRPEQAEQSVSPEGALQTSSEREAKILVEALQRIKQRVVGERIPHWQDDWQTTHSRGFIADLCDMAIGTYTYGQIEERYGTTPSSPRADSQHDTNADALRHLESLIRRFEKTTDEQLDFLVVEGGERFEPIGSNDALAILSARSFLRQRRGQIEEPQSGDTDPST